MGLPTRTAAEIVGIYASIRNGVLGADYEQHKPALGQVKLEDSAKEFAAAFWSGKSQNIRYKIINILVVIGDFCFNKMQM